MELDADLDLHDNVCGYETLFACIAFLETIYNKKYRNFVS